MEPQIYSYIHFIRLFLLDVLEPSGTDIARPAASSWIVPLVVVVSVILLLLIVIAFFIVRRRRHYSRNQTPEVR